MPLFIFVEPTASVIDGVHTCVCVFRAQLQRTGA